MQALTMTILTVFLVLGCQGSGAIQQQEKHAAKDQKETTMVNSVAMSKAVQPPIDLARPAKTETATFALG